MTSASAKSPPTAAAFYETLLTIRAVEERFLALFSEGALVGTTHPCIGQEAAAAGCCAALEPDDVVTSTHRGHGHYLAHTCDVEGLVAEVMGRSSGVCSGRGGSQHLQHGTYYTNGITGGLTAGATGMALAEKLRGSGRVVLAFLGDGALGQGNVYESFNIAALNRLPVVYACEVNRFAMSTRIEEFAAGSITGRAAAFGIPTVEVDGQDVFAVHAAAAKVVQAARRGEGPQFLAIQTYRFLGHSKSDKLEYRSKDEAAPYLARDPIALLRPKVPPEEAARIEMRVKQRVDAAVEKARAAREPAPTPETLCAHVFQPERPAPVLPRPKSDLAPMVAEEIRRALAEALERDPRVVLIGEDLRDPYGGAFKCTRGLTERFGARILNTPVSEAAIAGIAFGAAVRGLVPVAEIMFGDFITLAADQIVNQAAKYPWLTEGRVTLALTIRTPMGGRRGYGATHSQSIEKMMFGVPGLKVIAASHGHDVAAVTYAAVVDPNPVLLIENKKMYGKRLGAGLENFEIESHGQIYPTLVVRTKGVGEPAVTLVCYGGMLLEAAPAMEQAASEGIAVECVVPSRIAPLEDKEILASFRKTGRLVTAEESSAAAGFGAEVAARVAEQAYDFLRAPVRRVSAADAPIPCAKGLEDIALPGPDDIFRAIRETAEA